MTKTSEKTHKIILADADFAAEKFETPKDFFETPIHEILSAFQFSETAIRFSPLAISDNAFKQFVFRNVFPRSFFTLPKVDAGMFPTFSSW